jgi:HAD superfamily hydrolase (TIGR01549 family)
MIEWVFLDVGNVLLDEDVLTFATFSRHVDAIRRIRPDRSFEDLLAEREAKAEVSRWPVYEVASSYLDESAIGAVWSEAEKDVRSRYGALNPPIPGAVELLDRLRGHFRLGLIANQPREGREWFDRLGWLERFEVVVLSESEGVSKPDPALFRIALDRARTEPGRCLMVGDRLDNDVAPASESGMKSALVRWPDRAEKGWNPTDLEGIAYLRSLERSAARFEADWAGPTPSIVVDGLRGLLRFFEEPAIKGDSGSRPASDRSS